MNEHEEEQFNEQDALNAIEEIGNLGAEQAEHLLNITQQLNDIDGHITNIDEYLITKKEKEDEQENKEVDEKAQQKIVMRRGAEEEQEEDTTTLAEVYTEVQEVNDNLIAQNNILTVGIFSQGILIGVLLLSLFWKRLVR